jgi:hypothetical protein
MQIRTTSRNDATFETIVAYPAAAFVSAKCLSSRVERNDRAASRPHLGGGFGSRCCDFCCECLASMFEMAAVSKRRLRAGTAEDA